MLKQGTFIGKRFNKLLLGTIWGSLAFSVNMMIDSLISGNRLGELSLEAVSIVYPIFALIYFFSELVPTGAAALFGKHIGEFENEKAYRCAGSCLCFALLIGVLLSGALWIVKYPLLKYLGCSGELLKEAAVYYNWVALFALINPFGHSLFYLIVTDGESVFISLASVLSIAANIILSLALSGTYGIAGLGIASCIAELLSSIVYLGHFFRKSNNIRFRPCLDFKIVKRSAVLSFSNYMCFLFIALVDIVFNKIIIANCGIEYLPAYSVVNLVFSVCEIYLCIYDASVGMVTCFYGEKNNHSLKLIFRKIIYASLIMAGFVTAFFFFGAPLMPIIYGLKTPVTISASILTCKIMSFTALGFGLYYVGGMLFVSLEKPFQAFLLSILNDAIAPILLSCLLGYLWGFTGIVIGMSLSTYFAIGVYSLIMIIRRGKKGYPFYIEDFKEEGYSYDIYVTSESVIKMRDAISKELAAHGYEIRNIDLLMEEYFTRVMEKNPGKKVLASCDLLFGENQVRIIIRDNGVIFNFVDENNKIESLNAHVLNSLLENTKKKNYIITIGFNRNGFVFDK